ncbi:hypothetical protein EV182_003910 [Spiromyces aspiralis]|uniref:Uncharacterized protein n=1 Tax=Spiromyces aspiralis TaxID=68401 RepID=A0ACC1HTE1_9FUNG|nr:hypothetical protein EV182_003910 [Spiromyces aspiralis]
MALCSPKLSSSSTPSLHKPGHSGTIAKSDRFAYKIPTDQLDVFEKVSKNTSPFTTGFSQSQARDWVSRLVSRLKRNRLPHQLWGWAALCNTVPCLVDEYETWLFENGLDGSDDDVMGGWGNVSAFMENFGHTQLGDHRSG